MQCHVLENITFISIGKPVRIEDSVPGMPTVECRWTTSTLLAQRARAHTSSSELLRETDTETSK